MSTAPLLQSLFRHKAWANEELFAEVERLDPETQATERHAAIRLLNHLFVTDSIFAAHLVGGSHPYTASNTPETPTLGTLRAAVAELDHWFVDYAATLNADALAEMRAFRFTDGDNGYMSRAEMLAHVITHGSYHRGGIGRILSAAAITPPRDLFTAHLHRTEPDRRDHHDNRDH
ncbi:MAG: DinB family protein [Rhodocyclaceae bacterium]